MLPPPQARRGPPPIGLARSIRSLPRYRLRLPVPKSIRPAIVRSHHHFRTDRPHRQIYRVKRRRGPLPAHRTKDGIVDCIPNGLIVHEYTSCGRPTTATGWRRRGARSSNKINTHGRCPAPCFDVCECILRSITHRLSFDSTMRDQANQAIDRGNLGIDSLRFCDARKL